VPRRKRVRRRLAGAGVEAGPQCIVDDSSQGHPALARERSQASIDIRIEIDRRPHARIIVRSLNASMCNGRWYRAARRLGFERDAAIEAARTDVVDYDGPSAPVLGRAVAMRWLALEGFPDHALLVLLRSGTSPDGSAPASFE